MTAQPLSVMDADGKVAKGKDPNLAPEQLRTLYKTMVLTRTLDDRGLALQRQGGIGFYLQSTGQEASHIGSAFALKDSDWLFPAYRQPGIMLLRGADMDDIINEWYGNEGDTSKGRQMPVHYSNRSINFVSISSPIGTQLTHAAGAGMAAKMRGEDTVFMTYMGDGGTSSNDFHAGLNMAGVYKAPVVFICENNQWAISVPLKGQTASETIHVKADAYGMPGVRVDGNDVLAVYRVCKEAVDRARAGEGPTFIETVTYRIASHSSSDDADRYRDKAEWEAAVKNDPIVRFRAYLKQQGIWDEEFEKECVEGGKEQINAAVKRARERAMPAPETLFEDVFMNLTPQLRSQKNLFFSLEGEAEGNTGEFPL